VTQKSKPQQNYQKSVLKAVSWIRFLLQVKVSVKHYNIIHILCVIYFVTSLTMPDLQSIATYVTYRK